MSSTWSSPTSHTLANLHSHTSMNSLRSSRHHTAQRSTLSGNLTRLLVSVRTFRCILLRRPSFTYHVFLDTFMSKTTRLYQDTRTASGAGAGHLDKLNDELQDVTRIMTKNMEELLWRGDSLDSECAHLSPWPLSRLVDFVRHSRFRDVAFIDVSAVRVREVPQGGAEYQLPSDATAVCPHWRCCAPSHHPSLLAVLMRSDPTDWIHCTIYLRLSMSRTFLLAMVQYSISTRCESPQTLHMRHMT